MVMVASSAAGGRNPISACTRWWLNQLDVPKVLEFDIIDRATHTGEQLGLYRPLNDSASAFLVRGAA